MQQPYVLGIDIGTGSTKGVAVTRSGMVLATAQSYYNTLHTRPDFSEQDPEVIWQAFVKTIQRITQQLQQSPAAISLSSCMHSLILVDADGTPLTANLTWADRRSAGIADALRNTPEGETIYKATGTPLHAMSPLCKLRWFQQHAHEVFKKCAKAISIKEYIWYKVFGVYEIDHSIASATGLFDVQQLQWFQPALAFCGIDKDQLSTPVSTDFIRKGMTVSIAAQLDLPAKIPFCIGASDGCLANVGSDALQPGTAAVTIGTSGAVRIATSDPVVVFPEMIFNYRLDSETFVCGGAVNNGGNVVQWLLHTFLKKASPAADDYATLFQQAAAAPPASGGLLCLPYLAGERTPLWDEKACGAFVGIRAQHGVGHFIRAGLEGVCFALYGVLKKLEAASGHIHTLHVSGGLVHAPLWMQMLADVTGKTVCLLQTEDASAVGAALLYFKTTEQLDTYPSTQKKFEKTLVPDEHNQALYSSCFPIFQGLYTALQSSMHQLHSLKV